MNCECHGVPTCPALLRAQETHDVGQGAAAHAFMGPWEASFEDNGGYDCMTDAFYIKDASGNHVCTLDLADFGQDRCEWPASPEVIAAARPVAQRIAAAPALLDAARQASFCLRELLPNDADAQLTVRMLEAAIRSATSEAQ